MILVRKQSHSATNAAGCHCDLWFVLCRSILAIPYHRSVYWFSRRLLCHWHRLHFCLVWEKATRLCDGHIRCRQRRCGLEYFCRTDDCSGAGLAFGPRDLLRRHSSYGHHLLVFLPMHPPSSKSTDGTTASHLSANQVHGPQESKHGVSATD